MRSRRAPYSLPCARGTHLHRHSPLPLEGSAPQDKAVVGRAPWPDWARVRGAADATSAGRSETMPQLGRGPMKNLLFELHQSCEVRKAREEEIFSLRTWLCSKFTQGEPISHYSEWSGPRNAWLVNVSKPLQPNSGDMWHHHDGTYWLILTKPLFFFDERLPTLLLPKVYKEVGICFFAAKTIERCGGNQRRLE